MRILSLAAMGIVSVWAAELSVGDQLPMLKGEFLTGRTAMLPEAASGRIAVLLLGFTYDSRFTVEAWTKKFRDEFGKEPRVTFYEIPLIGGMGMLGKPFIDGGMRRGTPKADQENVITVYGGVDPWKKRVGFQDPKAAYVILIDGTGRVAWRTVGDRTTQRYTQLSSEVKKLLAENKIP